MCVCGFFGNFTFKQVEFGFGFEPGITKTWTRLGPTLGFILKTQTWPYYLSGQVKPNPLGSSWVLAGQVTIAIPNTDEDNEHIDA